MKNTCSFPARNKRFAHVLSYTAERFHTFDAPSALTFDFVHGFAT